MKWPRTTLKGLFAAVVVVASAVHAVAGDIRVAFINPGMVGEAFWLQVSATMQAAATQLGIDLDIRYTNREYNKALATADDILTRRPLPDFLIATNDIGAGGPIVKRADAAGVPVILLSNDLDHKDWAEFGEPRTKYRSWLGSIVPDHEGGGYGIAESVLSEAAKLKNSRPLRLLALAGDADTPANNDRVRGLRRALEVMRDLLGEGSVELIDVVNLDWTENSAETWVRGFLKDHPRIDAVGAVNDPTAFGAITALREAGYRPGADVVVGGLNWSQGGVQHVLAGDMLLTHGGHFLGGAWAMVIVRDYHDGRDFAEEDVRLQFPMGAIDLPIARRFPDLGKIDWHDVDFTRFSKTRNAAVTRYNFTPDAVLNALASAP